MKDSIFWTINAGPLGVTETCCGFDERVEHRLKIERRAADNLQHVGGRSLLPQGFAEFATARLHRVEQAHILNSDHRLVGERFQQLDMAGGKRTDFIAGDSWW